MEVLCNQLKYTIIVIKKLLIQYFATLLLIIPFLSH